MCRPPRVGEKKPCACASQCSARLGGCGGRRSAKERVERQRSKPRGSPDAAVVYLGHIPFGFHEKQMRGFFEQFGKVPSTFEPFYQSRAALSAGASHSREGTPGRLWARCTKLAPWQMIAVEAV